MTENAELASGDVEAEDAAWCAAQIDAAADSSSRFSMVEAMRRSAGISTAYDDLPSDISDGLKAMCWAFDYHVEIDATAPRHVHIDPRFTFGDRTEPPRLKEVPDSIQQIWADILQRVEHPAATSRLNHVLFEYGGRERQKRGTDAIDAYVRAAADWGRESDSFEDLKIGERLAHAIGDAARAQQCIDKLLDAVQDDSLAG
jgi:hypothetical protein